MFERFKRGPKSGGSAVAELPELKEVLGSFRLPTFPKVAMAVLRELRNPDSGMDTIAQRIALDPGLHSRVLCTINAAAFGLSRKVDDLQHALALLGHAKLESLVVAVAVKEVLPETPTPEFDGNSFWQASARRASLARHACSVVAPKEAAEALTVGLLQDLAVPILARVHQREYTRLYNQWRRDPQCELDELERAAFGYDHAQVGSLIAADWELSDHMATLIRNHHVGEPGSGLAEALNLTSRVRDLADPGECTDGLVERTSGLLRIPTERAQKIVASSFGDAREFLIALR